MATPRITTIQVTPKVRDRLKHHGLKGQSYSEVLDRLMDRLEYEEFMEAQYRQLRERKEFTPLDEIA
jgi:predicted CopG family antitoxin